MCKRSACPIGTCNAAYVQAIQAHLCAAYYQRHRPLWMLRHKSTVAKSRLAFSTDDIDVVQSRFCLFCLCDWNLRTLFPLCNWCIPFSKTRSHPSSLPSSEPRNSVRLPSLTALWLPSSDHLHLAKTWQSCYPFHTTATSAIHSDGRLVARTLCGKTFWQWCGTDGKAELYLVRCFRKQQHVANSYSTGAMWKLWAFGTLCGRGQFV